jgi:hypothetical protein
MNATLHLQRGPLFAILAVSFLALIAALAPGLAEVDLSGIAGDATSGSEAELTAAPGIEEAPTWVNDPLEPPVAGMERAVAARLRGPLPVLGRRNNSGGALEAPSEEDRGFSNEDSERLGAEARQARRHDRELSGRLGGPAPRGRVASGRYLHELGRRPNLPVALERNLVADVKRGDRRARAQLVEAFLPAVAGVARVYRGRGPDRAGGADAGGGGRVASRLGAL